jgi:membrane fusion protein (multidrug efflux system)
VKKRIALTALALVIIGVGFYAYHLHTTRYPSTDNAYVTADVVYVAPQVAGRVQRVLVVNQQYVHAGDRLYTIDPQPFQLALERARAHLQQVRQEVAYDAAAVVSAEQEVKRQEVMLQNAAQRADRSLQLQAGNFVSKQAVDDAQAAKLAASAALEVARAQLEEAREKLGQPDQDNQAVREAQAAVGEAQWALDNTELHATCDGRITQMTLQPGDAVQEGQSNFVVVCDHQFWIAANFKETELGRIRPGQPVSISVDMYPGREFQGEVDSINGASGVAFSLLPPQNASGNWVKVTQRVPVKIRIDRADPAYPLVVGTSAQVQVDTTGGV